MRAADAAAVAKALERRERVGGVGERDGGDGGHSAVVRQKAGMCIDTVMLRCAAGPPFSAAGSALQAAQYRNNERTSKTFVLP